MRAIRSRRSCRRARCKPAPTSAPLDMADRARRRARSAISRGAEVGAGLQRALRQLRRLRIARIQLKLRNSGRDVHYQPVPESAARGCVRIETSHGEALGAGRCSRPGQMWRLVVALAAEAKFGRKDVGVGQIVAVLETIAP